MTDSEVRAELAELMAEDKDFIASLADEIDCSDESDVAVGVGVKLDILRRSGE